MKTKKNTTIKTTEVPYCTHCKSICFQVSKYVTRTGIATEVLDINGYSQEIDFACDDSMCDEALCVECEEPLSHDITMDIDLFRKIREEVFKDKATNFFVKIPLEKGEDYEAIPPEKIREIIFEALI